MKKVITLLFGIQITGALFAQDAYIKGTISDAKNKETIVGASVIVDEKSGTATDIDGNYLFKITPGSHKVEFKYVGYKSLVKTIEAKENDTIKTNVFLEPDSKTLDIVVVSAGKFEQKLNEVTVSMEVIKPSLGENKAVTNVAQVVEQVPGVSVIDGQANIRGGAGFSYGAGSRVLVLVDEMPMLTAHQGDVKWSFLPIENCEQVEVIKGASSALFGSSAINGVINFRTGYAKDEPETKVIFNSAVYDKTKRKELVSWWNGKHPTYHGINFYHAQKFGQLDLVVGGNLFDDDGYQLSNFNQRARINSNLRYRFKKIPGLSAGVNVNTMTNRGGVYVVWTNPDSALIPLGGASFGYNARRTNIDPYIVYSTKRSRHSLRTRLFETEDLNEVNSSNTSQLYYSEYQFQHRFANGLNITTGVMNIYSEVHSGAIYGTHYSSNIAGFAQFDKKFDRLTASLGLRGEYFKTDSVETQENINWLFDASKPIVKNSKVKPVLRAGLNYKLKEYTFLRTSFGQGFRFPTVAERYIRTSASGLDVFPNDSLRPETGWSAEVAVKQGVKVGEFKGFLDVAVFWSEYRDMMEFTFGQYAAPTQQSSGLGFQSQNIGNTRIVGIEFSMMGQGKIGDVNVTTLLGYTYIDPRQTDFDPAVDTAKNTSPTNLLKYRYQHTGKADVQLDYKKWSTGVSMRANSFMENIDRVFGDNEFFFPGMKKYREEHNKGDIVWDYRLSYELNKNTKVAFVVNNVFNREVMVRPAFLAPQRVYSFQVVVKI